MIICRIENKDLFVDLRRNTNGVYLKLSERKGTVRNTVLIPASGILRLKNVLEEALQISMKNVKIRYLSYLVSSMMCRPSGHQICYRVMILDIIYILSNSLTYIVDIYCY